MNPKNWNDRADKDLFFTILSVKNIGIISGGEWTTIGNHMRSMGYGFTNEGCRQHFQGLRRSQNKADAKAAATDVVCRDPTLNPITRRPGPGRGRPRKLPAGSEGESPVDGAISPVAAHVPSAMPTPGTTQQSETPDQQEAQRQPPPPGKPDAVSATVPEAASLPTDVLTAAAAAVAATTDAAAHGSPREDGDAEADDDGTEKHPAKRQRLDTLEPEPGPEPEPEPEQPLDDEAVLALAAHNGAAGTDYAEDLSYGEA
ncbi:hypothetical protein ED733_005499 [Metarhizium rileyi]|uniref:Myb-like domain-containing protein n=1 Tax=Metarhizium rileyi (strain RCEF 4871) TaxID=1649241 RepID=A0A5C6GNC2_METRR|nr:hypothetical protein ED733_005499 [Metarhizium rileyi]